MRNADVGSDLNLLVAKITLKLRNAKIGMARNQRPDISRLKEKSGITLRNRFSILQEKTILTINDYKTVMMESAKETIGYMKTCKSERISP